MAPETDRGHNKSARWTEMLVVKKNRQNSSVKFEGKKDLCLNHARHHLH